MEYVYGVWNYTLDNHIRPISQSQNQLNCMVANDYCKYNYKTF